MVQSNKRWRAFADAKMQGAFCLRIVVYWLTCQIALCATVAGMASLDGSNSAGGGSVIRFIVPAFFFSLLILPLVLLDAIVFTNRIAGPLFNFRKKLNQLVETGESDRLCFRPGDYFADVARNYNCLRDRVMQQPTNKQDVNESASAECEIQAV